MTVQQSSPDDPTAFRPAQAAAPAQQLTPGVILGERYRIVSLIAKGGMGEVYRADDLKLGQTVALKFLTHHGDRANIYEEVRIGRQVSHPNVCRLYDIAEADGRLFITMEFVDGEDLASLLRRIGRLPAEKALMLTREICAGLSAAHDKGVIHRDLKPANVMIDGRGRARVTDFGLAQAAGRTSDGAGTPAYMAPELLAGESASIKSDLYALGLVLYEIFTGRRAFDASSLQDQVARQRSGDFTRPSNIARDVPAAVERMIVRCLDPDRASRPDSVEEILVHLPGGDPLAAAIAAGETPSPAMVAAAADRGDLPVRLAWTLLAVYASALIVYGALTARTMLYRRVPIKSPEFLRDRVDEVLAATGQKLLRADSSAIYVTDLEQVVWREKNGRTAAALSPILFLYRQSPRPMLAEGYEHRVTRADPPLLYSGMADVALDSNGRLVQLTVVPPQNEPPPQRPAKVDWTQLLRFSGLTSSMSPTTPQWAAPVDSDEKAAWVVSTDGTRIEAAAYHGRPVWFFVIPPWRPASRMSEPQEEVGSRISTVMVVVLNAAFWTAAIALALRNLRRGQSDRRGAVRLALTVLIILFAGCLMLAHHVADAFGEMILISSLAGLVLLMTAMTWVGYIAIEPLVRRRYPRMLIGVTRLLSGRVRDPIIGRDLLVGTTVGLIVVLLRQLIGLYPGTPPLQSASLTLSGLRYAGWFASAAVTIAIVGPIFAATLLVGLHVLTRNIRAAAIITGILGALMVLGDLPGPLWIRLILGAMIGTIVLVILFRFGLLAYGAGIFSYVFIRRLPITLDPGAWYFGRSAVALVLMMTIASYGFAISLSGKRWLPQLDLDE